MAMHQVIAAHAGVTHPIAIMDERGRMQPQWQLEPEAIAILADCAISAPLMDTSPRTHIMTGEPLLTFDQADPRVTRLRAISNDAFLENEARCMAWGMTYGAGPDVHQIIAQAIGHA